MTIGTSDTLSALLPVNVAFSKQERERILQHTKLHSDIARQINIRDIGIYDLNQNFDGQQWFTAGNPQIKRVNFRKVFSFSSIASGTELDIPTNLTGVTIFTRIYGTVITNVPDFRPLPYIDPATLSTGMAILVGTVAGIQQIRIVVGATAPAVTSGIAVLEYLLN